MCSMMTLRKNVILTAHRDRLIYVTWDIFMNPMVVFTLMCVLLKSIRLELII